MSEARLGVQSGVVCFLKFLESEFRGAMLKQTCMFSTRSLSPPTTTQDYEYMFQNTSYMPDHADGQDWDGGEETEESEFAGGESGTSRATQDWGSLSLGRPGGLEFAEPRRTGTAVELAEGGPHASPALREKYKEVAEKTARREVKEVLTGMHVIAPSPGSGRTNQAGTQWFWYVFYLTRSISTDARCEAQKALDARNLLLGRGKEREWLAQEAFLLVRTRNTNKKDKKPGEYGQDVRLVENKIITLSASSSSGDHKKRSVARVFANGVSHFNNPTSEDGAVAVKAFEDSLVAPAGREDSLCWSNRAIRTRRSLNAESPTHRGSVSFPAMHRDKGMDLRCTQLHQTPIHHSDQHAQ